MQSDVSVSIFTDICALKAASCRTFFIIIIISKHGLQVLPALEMLVQNHVTNYKDYY